MSMTDEVEKFVRRDEGDGVWFMIERNSAGITPIQYHVIVKPDEVQEKTKGGVYLPDDHKEREAFATMRGEIVAVSDMAFLRTASGDDWIGPRPKPGDRVMTAKYAGSVFDGDDGVKYRIMKDEDVIAIV